MRAIVTKFSKRGTHMQTSEAPIGYMERTRLYYRALGYPSDYVWATFENVPFTPLAMPLSAARIALVTTSSAADRANRRSRPPIKLFPCFIW